MRNVSWWMKKKGMALAEDKTEVILLTRKHIPLNQQFTVGLANIASAEAVKYLGVWLDCRMNFGKYIDRACKRASTAVSSLARLMANTDGPSASKWKLLMSVTSSIMLYGCELWADKLGVCTKKKLQRVQRKAALRIAADRQVRYRGSMPTESVVEVWQKEWDMEDRGKWTSTLIRNIAQWQGRRHGEVPFFLTQALSGHGYFFKYLHRMGKVPAPACQYGDSKSDDAEHTVVACRRWEQERGKLVSEVGVLQPKTFVKLMLESVEKWSNIELFVTTILISKHSETLCN